MPSIEDRLRAQLEGWRRDLINLTRNNRLLYFRQGSALEIVEPGATDVYAKLGAGLKVRNALEPDLLGSEADPRRLRANEVRISPPAKISLVSKLRNLDRNATQTFMDRGLWVLYLGFGILEWQELGGDGKPTETVRSPLLLVPVTVKRESSQDPFEICPAKEEQKFNPALLSKLEEEFDLTLTLPDDEEGLTPETLFRSIQEQVAKRGWRVHPNVVLSTFSFHKEPILRDLTVNESLVLEHSAVKGLALATDSGVTFEFDPVSESAIDELAPPETTVTILDADASQRKAIAAVGAGQSFVMDGPPGTGKSQTIANMIADLLAKQKTVLFVSDKAAALDVVFKRLHEAGLSEFVLELHSHKATRKEVAKALGRSLQARLRVGDGMTDADLELLRNQREELSAYVEALNAPRSPLGQSLHHVIGRIAQSQQLPQAPPPSIRAKDLDQARWALLSGSADALGRAWGPIARGEKFHWRHLADGNWDQTRRVRVTSMLSSASLVVDALVRKSLDVAARLLLPEPKSTSDAEALLSTEEHLIRRGYVQAHWLSRDLEPIRQTMGDARTKATEAAQMEADLLREVGPNWQILPLTGPDELRTLAAKFTVACPGLGAADGATVAWLRASANTLSRAEQHLAHVQRRAPPLAHGFQVIAEQMSLERVVTLAQLGMLATASDLPEPAWLSTAGLARAQAAALRLRPLLETARQLEEQVKDVFTRRVLELDLESLCVRFETVYRSFFAWLKSDFRRDRSALKSATRTGRVRREEISRLREALQWQQAVRTFQSASIDSSSALGAQLQGEASDFDSIERALGVASQAITLAGPDIPPEAIASKIGRGAASDGEVLAAATSILGMEPAWKTLDVSWANIEKQPLAEARETAVATITAISALADALADIDSVANAPARLVDAIRWLTVRQRVDAIERKFDLTAESDREMFGARWRLRRTDWDSIEQGLDWASALMKILGGQLAAATADRLATLPAETPRLSAPIADWAQCIQEIVGQFDSKQGEVVRLHLRTSMSAAKQLLADLSETIDDIGEWYAHTNAIATLEEQKLGGAVAFCLSQRVPASQVRSILERSVLEAWADEILKSDPRLKYIRATDRDASAKKFQQLDRELVRLAARQTISECNRRRPVNLQGAAGIIMRQAEIQKRHMPIRDLIQKSREVALALKPCFMMSPLSVSQFLPPDLVFDVVIFDEASQVRPSDSISSIYRGRQLVVAGDQKQLPPTSFFEGVSSGDEDVHDEDEPEVFESVLDLCKGSGVFTSLPLRWHYRSQHEHLITYSNYSFYDGRLVTFPGAVSESPDLGVEVIRVNGIYRRAAQRDNPIEAAAVAERVLFHAQNYPARSIGVVAFSEAQASTIDAVLEKMADQHPEIRRIRDDDRLNGLFVKNLETVQGDERDVIIFSMGYGKDEAGKFTMQFGPVGKSGGERRLNVAITRARRKIEFVTSVRLSDFLPELGSDGARHLRRYLEFAERRENRLAVLAIPESPSQGDFESPFEVEVARVIRSWGYEVVPQVGCSEYRIDLGIRHPSDAGRFVIGIECDGAMYHSSHAARDRDRLRQEVLERLGWQLHRIWGPSWYRNRSEQEARLRKAIDRAVAGGPAAPKPPSAPVEESPRPVLVSVNLDSGPLWATPYVPAKLPEPRVGNAMHEGPAQLDLQRIVQAIIVAEGPVHGERVLRRAREAFGVGRAGNRIRQAFETAIQSIKAKGTGLRQKKDFLWFDGQRTKVRTPREGEPDTERSIAEVPSQELELAVSSLIDDALRIDRSSVVMYVARLFGWDRSGAQIATAIDGALRRLVSREAIVKDGDAFLPAGRDGAATDGNS